MSKPNSSSTQIGIHEVYCVECGAETQLDCICDDLNYADGDRVLGAQGRALLACPECGDTDIGWCYTEGGWWCGNGHHAEDPATWPNAADVACSSSCVS